MTSIVQNSANVNYPPNTSPIEFDHWRHKVQWQALERETLERKERKGQFSEWLINSFRPEYRIDLTYSYDVSPDVADTTAKSWLRRMSNAYNCTLVSIGVRERTKRERLHWHYLLKANAPTWITPQALEELWGNGRVAIKYLTSKEATTKFETMRKRSVGYVVKYVGMKRYEDALQVEVTEGRGQGQGQLFESVSEQMTAFNEWFNARSISK